MKLQLKFCYVIKNRQKQKRSPYVWNVVKYYYIDVLYIENNKLIKIAFFETKPFVLSLKRRTYVFNNLILL